MPRQKARPSTNPLHTRDPLDYDVALAGLGGWLSGFRVGPWRLAHSQNLLG